MAKKREVSPSPTLSPRKTRSGAVSSRSGVTKKAPAAAPKRAAIPSKLPASAKKQKAAQVKLGAKPTAGNASPASGVKVSVAPSGKTVIIEACTQCQSFKRTALKVKEGLEEHLSDIVVEINPNKPRRGYFEVRNGGNAPQVFLSLPEMKRPFQKMKELDIPDVVKSIVEKLK